MEIWIGLCIFLFTLLLIYEAYFIVRNIYKPEQRKVRERLRTLSKPGPGNGAIDILKKKNRSEIPWLNRILLNISFFTRLERLLYQAGTSNSLSVFVILSVLLFFGGLLLATVLKMSLLVMALPSILLSTAPFLYLSYKRKKRMAKFERQLPEALELTARALKAGHAFTGGLRMVAEELGDPVGDEFANLLDEINYGIGVPEALTNLTQRVDCEDLRFFAVSVIIQRETGGNLAEILDSLGRLIRERFKFQGRVRVLSAEGRISAIVLVAMPFLVAGVLFVLRPEYIGILASDTLGRLLAVMALVLMSFGIYVMKKMVSIKV